MSCVPKRGRWIDMRQIIIAGEKLKLYGCLKETCKYVCYTDEWRDRLWEDLLANPPIYREFLYYMEHQDFLCQCTVNGYSIIDIFIWEMRKYNVRTDRGKNGADCDKTAMLLEAFRTMIDMKGNGARIEWSMEMRNGMDEF